MTNCEECIYYSYDEEYDSYFCEQSLDEDEMARFLRGEFASCPFYRRGESDYYLSSRQ
ncbi:MAG: hypothetical protein IKL99_01640 [Oscillospiraceae bacterium]|nr:hypothetical protein [Oscillospiraceae bacterium]